MSKSDKPSHKLGKDLQVGDVIEFWCDVRGMRVIRLLPYNGPFANFICATADLQSVNTDNFRSVSTSVETGMRYKLVQNSH